MTDSDEKLLEDDGWTIECNSPFEIRKEESFASNYAAKLVLFALRISDAQIIVLGGDCEEEGCDQPATAVCENRDEGLGCYCEKHAKKAVEVGHPEYKVSCPNCGCGFGVN